MLEAVGNEVYDEQQGQDIILFCGKLTRTLESFQ
jgi:hypothetical protein